jgi:hypothetical protein
MKSFDMTVAVRHEVLKVNYGDRRFKVRLDHKERGQLSRLP